MFGVIQVRAAQISSSVRPVDCVSRKNTCVTVTMTAETTRMKPTVEKVNVMLPDNRTIKCMKTTCAGTILELGRVEGRGHSP